MSQVIESEGMFGQLIGIMLITVGIIIAIMVISALDSTIDPPISGVTDNLDAMTNPEVLQNIMSKIDTQRVDFIGMGDSNQGHAGTESWDDGFQTALDANWDSYATGYLSLGDQTGFGLGYGYSRNSESTVEITNAPVELEVFFNSTQNPAHNYAYVAPGDVVTDGTRKLGTRLMPSTDIGFTDEILFELHYGTFETGTGNFTAAIMDDGGGITILDSQFVNPVTGSYSMDRVYLTLPADPSRPEGVAGGFVANNQGDINGPFFGTMTRAINESRDTGWSYHTQIFKSGGDLRDFARDLQDSNDEYWSYYYGEIRRAQTTNGQDPFIVFVINSGVNDRSQSADSVGPNPAATNTKEGYKDNLQAIINELNSIWISNGWNVSELHFIIMPSHPIATPDAELIPYREGAVEVANANPRTVMIDLDSVTSWDEIVTNSWSSGIVHLTNGGYDEISSRIFNSTFTTVTSSASDSREDLLDNAGIIYSLAAVLILLLVIPLIRFVTRT